MGRANKEIRRAVDPRRIVKAIAAAEAKTSGEIRVFIQRGEVNDPVAEARQRFEQLGMSATRERNGVLSFVAPRSQRFAVIGDAGIHERGGDKFWQALVEAMRPHLKAAHFTDTVVHAIEKTGDLLSQHFPRRPDDRDELPNTVLES